MKGKHVNRKKDKGMLPSFKKQIVKTCWLLSWIAESQKYETSLQFILWLLADFEICISSLESEAVCKRSWPLSSNSAAIPGSSWIWFEWCGFPKEDIPCSSWRWWPTLWASITPTVKQESINSTYQNLPYLDLKGKISIRKSVWKLRHCNDECG